MLSEVLVEFPAFDWEEVDVANQPEVAERYGIMSAPAVVIDGRLEFRSVPKPNALRDKFRTLQGGTH